MTDTVAVDDVPHGTSDKKVLILIFDGVRWDKLQEARTPNIDTLAAEGSLGRTMTYDPDEYSALTVSGPGHSTLLTGVWPDKHRVLSNVIEPNELERFPDVLTRLRNVRPDLSTFAIGDWPPLMEQIIDAPHVKILHPSNEGTGEGASSARQIIAWASATLSRHNPDVGYVYLILADVAGHRFGGASAAYIEAIEQLDREVSTLVQALRGRPTYDQEDWLILAATDHGHLDEGGHGGGEPEVRDIWTLAVGGDIRPAPVGGAGMAMVDIVPTALRHLGVEIDPSWELDGAAADELGPTPERA
ncbi:alkaline phosphatase family protein [Phytoactinopolyspora endophytica]|uniref:alkaline phosphatase family protein n=1 Tax=Phytoactinopolyspora endophytica TaxID=1642495 RepID=UPI00101D0FEB|nr:alkaline phosphatase family protein [Phytoactinopolyspora endophytica]